MTSSSLPNFGEADLSNCEREPIHLAGSIQPHGALLVLDEDLTIMQASANAAAFLNCEGTLVGRPLSALPGTMAARLGAHLGEPLRRRAVAVRGRIGEPSLHVDALMHRPASGGLVVELEKVGPSINVRSLLDTATQVILNAASMRALCDEAARVVEQIAGYDRVMVYRFDDLGHGEVYSEVRRPELEAFLGNRYPASDIPQIARRLYLENRVRLLFDVAYQRCVCTMAYLARDALVRAAPRKLQEGNTVRYSSRGSGRSTAPVLGHTRSRRRTVGPRDERLREHPIQYARPGQHK